MPLRSGELSVAARSARGRRFQSSEEGCRVLQLGSDSVEVYYRNSNDRSTVRIVLNRIAQASPRRARQIPRVRTTLRAMNVQVSAGDSGAVASTRVLNWVVDVLSY